MDTSHVYEHKGCLFNTQWHCKCAEGAVSTPGYAAAPADHAATLSLHPSLRLRTPVPQPWPLLATARA